MNDLLEKIQSALRNSGLAVVGCGEQVTDVGKDSTVHSAHGEAIRLDWDHTPTPEELADADVAIAGLDMAEKVEKPTTEIATEVKALDTKTKGDLHDLMLSDYIRRFPDFAKKNGVDIDGRKEKA